MNSKRIYDHALRDNGLQETPGARSTPRIQSAILAAANWLDPDDSKRPGVAAFVAFGESRLALASPANTTAQRPGRIGKPVKSLDEAMPGDTIVMSRPGGNHVCLYVRHNATHVWCYGGNQADSCNVTRFPRDRVTHIRRG